MNKSIVSLLLLVSGTCALVFQTAWLREFRLVFGASTPATAAVLAIFMGGLGLGNLVLGKRADVVASPLRFFAQLELAIGAMGLASPFLVQLVRAAYLALGGQEALGAIGATAVRLVLSALVIGPPTFFMGGTLAAAVRAVTAADDESRRDVGWLYGMNTLGAVAGALLSTFLLLEWLGNRETLFVAGAVGLINAAVAWGMSHRLPAPAIHPAVSKTRKPTRPAEKQRGESKAPVAIAQPAVEPTVAPTLVYAAALVVGFVFFLMELVWYRMLGAILGGTTFTFGLILAMALAGIGVGGAIYPAIFRRHVPTLRDFAFTCGCEALALAVPFALGDRLALLAYVLQALRYFGFTGQVIGWAVVAGIVVFPASVAAGVQFPVLIALLGRGSRDLGRQIGLALAWNTLGAVLGSLAGGFGLLPLLSAIGAWKLAAIVLIAAALAAMWLSYQRDKQAAPFLQPALATAAAALCLTAVGPTSVWRHSSVGAGRARPPAATSASANDLKAWLHDRRRNFAWETDGLEASVAVATGGSVAFLVNGKSDGNAVTDAATQIMFPVLAAMLHPAPRETFVIGLGTGESAGWLAALPGMERVDVVELEPAIAKVADMSAPLNHDVLRHPKVRLVYGDAREVVQTTRRQYDLIASEPSNPYRAGVSSLYTLDFYQHAARRLKPGGMFVQWLQGYEIDIPTVRTVLATLHRAFRFIEIWETKPGDMVLICSDERPTYDLARLRSRLNEPAYKDALRIGWRTTRVEGVLAHFVANEKFVSHVAADEAVEPNTDNCNLLEYRFARTVGRGADFAVGQLREEAIAAGYGQPTTIGDDADWEVVRDQLIAYEAALSEPPLIFAPVTDERHKRALALQHYFQENLPAVATAWEAQSKPPDDIIEITVLALAYADQGDEKAGPLIERLEKDCPLDAQILQALLLERQDKHVEAADRLAQAIVKLRTDASVLPRLVDTAYSLASQIAKDDREQAAKLFQALSEPLAVWQFNDGRLLTRCLLGQQLGAGQAAIAVAALEPHIPWNASLLELRRNAYEATDNPLAKQARRDLDEFRRQAGQTAVLRSP